MPRRVRACPGTISALRGGEVHYTRPAMPPLTSSSAHPTSAPLLDAGSTTPSASKQRRASTTTQQRHAHNAEVAQCLAAEPVHIGATRDEGLRRVAWLGVDASQRAEVWRLLTGYMSVGSERRARDLQRKRREYFDYVHKYYTHGILSGRSTEEEKKIHNQILLDLPRHSHELFRSDDFRMRMERVLYIWSLRHPASGYVQGMDDIVFPFFFVFLEARDWAALSEEDANIVEADAYWCGGTLLGWVQDHYTFAQPGVQQMVHRLQHVVQTVDANLFVHIDNADVRFLNFAFQWMHCLLVRELPMHIVVRLWDTYLAEAHGFADFHVFVCASLLLTWREALLAMSDMEEILRHLQSPPVDSMTDKDVDAVVSQAYLLQLHYAALQ
eukprot:PhM_4_TR4755/c0_g1_i1/m.16660/K20360/TBC1D22, GYP1; TBC1 domain family member 2